LQALIALGGHNVAATVVVDALWPDADGGCGRRALDVALLRLRRLLGRDDAIQVSGGRLSINSELCWVDAWAFERAVDAAEDLGPGCAPERLRQVADTVISLYQGRFLGAEDDRPWMMPARDRLAAKFARAVGSCARALVAAGLRNEAEALYRRGLELDNLSEALYRGLMDCCAEQGHRAEAINAYRRCRELLSIVLNTRPSEQTELLYRRLCAG
jgi:DNA-binding SARP family transcriptional activator